jgi:drug/metabolite transporter (DMT)-like permease
MVAAGTCFSLMAALIRPASENLHTFEVLFFRDLFGLLLMTPWLARAGFGALRTRRPGLYLLRALFMFVSMATWFYAIPLVPLADAISLHFTAPLFVILLAILILGEVVRAQR